MDVVIWQTIQETRLGITTRTIIGTKEILILLKNANVSKHLQIMYVQEGIVGDFLMKP